MATKTHDLGNRAPACKCHLDCQPFTGCRKAEIDSVTAGELRDLLDRASRILSETLLAAGVDEHWGLVAELNAVETLLKNEIGGSHMGCGADTVLVSSEACYAECDEGACDCYRCTGATPREEE